MKILHITPHFSPFVGGLENMVLALATEQAKSHTVTVLTLKHDETLPDEETMQGVKIIRHPSFNLLKNQYSWPQFGFCENIAEINPDVVFTHTRFFPTSLFAGKQALKMKKSNRAPLVKGGERGGFWIHVEHGQNFVQSKNIFIKTLAKIWDHTLGKWIFRNADQVVVLSEEGKNFVKKITSSSFPSAAAEESTFKNNIHIIPNGVKISEKITPAPRKNKALFFGRNLPEKGIEEVQKARKACPAWNIEIIHNLPHEEIFKKIEQSDLLLLPSWSEGHSLAVLEAAAAGRPILATPVGQNEKIISPEFIVPINKAEALIEKLKELNHQFETLEREGRKNWQKVAENFSFDTMVQKYEKLLVQP